MAFLGDSLTSGWRLPEDEAYPALVARALAARGRSIRVINAGVSGDTAARALARLPEVLKHRPDVLVVALGANDGLGAGPLDETEAALGRIVVEARAAGARVLLVGIRLGVGPKAPRVGAGAGDAARAERLLQRSTPALAAAHRVAVRARPARGRRGETDLLFPDRLHPNAAGQARLAQNVLAPARARPGRGRGGKALTCAAWSRSPGSTTRAWSLLEKTGLGRWRSWLDGRRPLPAASSTSAAAPAATSRSSGAACARSASTPATSPCSKARRRAPGVPLVRARAEALPFRDGAFDTVVSGLVFCSVADVPRGLGEVRRGAEGRGCPEDARARPRERSRGRAAPGPDAAGVDVVHGRLPPQPRHRGRGRGGGLRRRPRHLSRAGRHAALRASPEHAAVPVGVRGISKASPESPP